MTAMECWRFARFLFYLTMAEVAGQAYTEGRVLGTTQARKSSELVPVINESRGMFFPSLTVSGDPPGRRYVGTLVRMSMSMRVVACCWPGVHPY